MGSHPADHPGPLVFVDDLAAPHLHAADRHHLERVRRLRPGAPITIGDGTGRWCPARFGPSVEVTGAMAEEPWGEPQLTVAFAVLKGDRNELVVQKLTELGVDRIVPVEAARCVVRWDVARQAKAVERWRAVARGAAMQAHRARLPEVATVTDLAEVAGWKGAALADRVGAPVTLAHPVVVVGPEGGWDDAERALGLPTVSLGPHVLRAETAAITAGALLAAARHDAPGTAR